MVVNEQVRIVETELDFLNRFLSSPAPH